MLNINSNLIMSGESGPMVPLPDPPVTDFVGGPTSGESPLDVTFTDLSTNTPTSWLWDFGDTNSSALQNPDHTYGAAGEYTVSLTAANLGGSDQNIKTDYITVSDIPPTLLLDDYPGAYMAVSLEKIRTDYAGPIVNLRRSSDSATQLFYAGVDNKLDFDAILTWTGAGNTSGILTWYDQSATRNITQGNYLNSRIVDTGVLVVDSLGNPTVKISLPMKNTSITRSPASASMIYSACSSSGGALSVFEFVGPSPAYSYYGHNYSSLRYYNDQLIETTVGNALPKSGITSIFTAGNQGTTVPTFRWWNNSGFLGSNTPSPRPPTGNSSSGGYSIGGNAISTGAIFVSEQIYYTSGSTANQAGIEANMSARYL